MAKRLTSSRRWRNEVRSVDNRIPGAGSDRGHCGRDWTGVGGLFPRRMPDFGSDWLHRRSDRFLVIAPAPVARAARDSGRRPAIPRSLVDHRVADLLAHRRPADPQEAACCLLTGPVVSAGGLLCSPLFDSVCGTIRAGGIPVPALARSRHERISTCWISTNESFW